MLFYGITKLNVENSFIKYFKEDSEIFRGMKLIDSELGGTTPLDIVFEMNKEEKIINNLSEKNDIEDDIMILILKTIFLKIYLIVIQRYGLQMRKLKLLKKFMNI